MHHGPNCGGPPADRPYYDALAESTANLVRVRELEADAERQRQRRQVMDQQILLTGLQRGDREELRRQEATAPSRRMLPPAAPSRPLLPPAPPAEQQELFRPQTPIRRPAIPTHIPRSTR